MYIAALMLHVKAGFWTCELDCELDCGLDCGLAGLWTKIWIDAHGLWTHKHC